MYPSFAPPLIVALLTCFVMFGLDRGLGQMRGWTQLSIRLQVASFAVSFLIVLAFAWVAPLEGGWSLPRTCLLAGLVRLATFEWQLRRPGRTVDRRGHLADRR